jgi:type VI secretion system protein ImpE
MNPKDLIRAGRLSEARDQLTAEVKSSPSDASKRTLLFQVLSFYGEWDKAERHLDLIVSGHPSAETGVQVYRNLVAAEKERREVRDRKRPPGFLTGVPPYLELYFAAWDALAQKKYKEALKLYAQIDAQRPTVSGVCNGKRFSGLKDTDTFLSSFLETIVHDKYIWLPFESLRELSISPPKTLLDLLWTQARIVTWEGLTMNCYLPVLYPDSFLHEDDRVKLGRMTDWIPMGHSFCRGVGEHVYQLGSEEIAILEIRDVTFELPAPGGNGDNR